MLNQNQSKRVKFVKVLTILPLLTLFLFSFNTKELLVAKQPIKRQQLDQFPKLAIEQESTKGLVAVPMAQTDDGSTVPNSFGKKPAVIAQPPIAADTQITKVTLEIDKTSSVETLKDNSDFLAKRGVSVKFKNIKQNAKGEITAIKVSYDNGAADTGNYQQRRTDGIEPFVVMVQFNPDSPAQITVGAWQKKSTLNHAVWSGLDQIGEHDDIRIKRGASYKTLDISKNGYTDIIFIDGNEVSLDSLANLGKLEQAFVKVVKISDKDNNTIVTQVKVADSTGSSRALRLLENDTVNATKKYILTRTDVLKMEESGDETIVHLVIDDDDDDESDEDDEGSMVILQKTPADDQGKEPLYLIDGVEATKKQMKNLLPNSIKSVYVLKGKKAVKKYGIKGENGVVEISTKEED